MRLSKKGFYAISVLFALGGAFLFGQLCLSSRQLGPFGYREASIQTMHGKLVFAIVPGPRQYPVTQYLFEDTQTGKLKKLYDLFTSDSIRFDRDKGKIFDLSIINDQILTCGLDGQELCSAKCASPPQCEALKLRVSAARAGRYWRDDVVYLVLLGVLYFFKVWRNRPLRQTPQLP